jgi:hypothetical protein
MEREKHYPDDVPPIACVPALSAGAKAGTSLMARVFDNFRREMWTILGETTFDIPRVEKGRHQRACSTRVRTRPTMSVS